LIFIPWHFPLHNDSNIKGSSKKAKIAFEKRYPVVYSHLCEFKEKLSQRNKSETGIRYEWYALQRCAASYYWQFDKEKIVWGNLSTDASYAIDDTGAFIIAPCNQLTSNTESVKYLVSLLNSRLLSFIFKDIAYSREGGYYEFKKVFVEQLPIIKADVETQLKLERLVNQIQHAKHSNSEADTNALEREIDQLVYQLYGLTEEEIAIVEGG